MRIMIGDRLYQQYLRWLSDRFHRAYYGMPATWKDMWYFGHRVFQYPGDLWLYQQIIYHTRPAYIIQTGVAGGGSLLYFAHMLDLLGADKTAVVVGIDVSLSPSARQLQHSRIHLIEGNSTDAQTVQRVAALLPPGQGLVSLDSDHSCAHVRQELDLYQQFVGPGGYLVVEDTNLNGHPVWSTYGAGPYEAVEAFLRGNRQFVRDDALWQRNLFSFHQYGWLKRLPGDAR